MIDDIKNIHGCANNPENFSTTKIGEHVPCGYSMSTIWTFDHIKSKHTLYNKHTSLREHATNVINFGRKKMLPLTKKELNIHQDVTECYICGKRFFKKFVNDKNFQKVRDHCHFTGKYRGAAHSICNLRLNVPNEIPVVYHNGPNYYYHFIIKELVNKFQGQFESLGENTEKYKTFSVPIEKEVKSIDIDGSESVVTISYKIKIIARFMAILLSNLVDNLAKRIHKIKRKNCDCLLEYESVNDNF